MAKRKRRTNAGGLARGLNFQNNEPTLKQKLDAANDANEQLFRIVDGIKNSFSMIVDLPKEETKSPRIKESVFNDVKSEADRLGLDIHCYLASVANFTQTHVNNSGLVGFPED